MFMLFMQKSMDFSSGGRGAVPSWIFIHDTDIVDRARGVNSTIFCIFFCYFLAFFFVSPPLEEA